MTSVRESTPAVRVEPPTARPEVHRARILLEDGSTYEGVSFGRHASTSGEFVFCTGMMGYPETLTDPSYCGQVVVSTYPMVGNYGVPARDHADPIDGTLESDRIWVKGLVVADYSPWHSHWTSRGSLGEWLDDEGITGVTGIDTRALTKRLREHGSMLGKIVVDEADCDFDDPNIENLATRVSVREPVTYAPTGNTLARVALLDCGVKLNIIRSLTRRGVEVLRVPWDHPVDALGVDGLMISNGPGNPRFLRSAARVVRTAIDDDMPTFGVCMGNQLVALAIGASTFKLKYGHRGQNQPVREVGTRRCYVTSQNHGFAVAPGTLPNGWSPWFENLNDGTNEGLRHESGRFFSVQFHPEACPGPVDTAFLFDRFVEVLTR
ncbi:MAG: glutamine-hydrolyzing carbamoyl-phosphate synthase small subunit [Planctomycetota bacterium]